MTTPGRRLRGLDGLRGIAALVVMIDHILLCSPTLAVAGAIKDQLTAGQTALTFSPLHIVWAGSEAVLVFFVLSGFVLTHAMLGERRPSWVDYYPRRVVRLYLPAVAALLCAFPLARWLRPSTHEQGASAFYNAHVGTGSVHDLVWDATLWHQRPSLLDGPLWSLHWEVLFSLLLPTYLLLTRIGNRTAALLTAGALLVVVAWGVHEGSGNAHYLPVFGLGVLAAAHQDRLRELAGRWSVPLLVVGVLLLTAPWTAWGITDVGPRGIALLTAASVAGGALVVVAFLDGVTGQWAAGSAVVRWLGKRSFSLYLVHAPLIISIAFVLGGHPPVWLLLLVCPPVCLAAAELFGRLVEEPAHRLSKRVGAAVEARVVGAEGIEPPTTRL